MHQCHWHCHTALLCSNFEKYYVDWDWQETNLHTLRSHPPPSLQFSRCDSAGPSNLLWLGEAIPSNTLSTDPGSWCLRNTSNYLQRPSSLACHRLTCKYRVWKAVGFFSPRRCGGPSGPKGLRTFGCCGWGEAEQRVCRFCCCVSLPALQCLQRSIAWHRAKEGQLKLMPNFYTLSNSPFILL